MMMKLKELNAKLDQTPHDLAGVLLKPAYAVGRLGDLHRCSKTHAVLTYEAVESSDPDVAVGTVSAYTLCDGTREARVLGRCDLSDLDCEKCREALRKIVIRLRKGQRRGGKVA